MSAFTRIASRYIVPATARTTTTGLRVAFDSEADGLLDITKVHCIAIADLDGDQIAAYGPEQIAAALEHMARAGYLTGHNICTYDLPLLKQLYNWSPAPDCVVVDTQVAGRLILPNINDLDDKAAAMGDQALGKLRGRYSIEAWGQRLGIPKSGTEITDWSHWTPAMQERCAGDAMICKALWWFLAPDGYSQAALALEHRAAMVCAEISAAGAPFHADAAAQLHEQWTERRAELAAQLQQLFPGVKLSSRKQIGALLEARGWVPERRTEKTKQPKIDDELLETIPDIFPEFAGLAEYMLLGRRLAQLSTGAKAWRKHIGIDGRIHGSVVHIGTPHSRAKHLAPNLAQVPNPKKGSPFGAECRALFRPDNGWVCVAADQSLLQDRGFAHYLHHFDAGAYAQTFLIKEDTHWRTATALGLVTAGTPRDKDNKIHTVIREGGKRFRYAFLYGCQAATAGHIIYDIARAAHHNDNTNNLLRQFFGDTPRPSEIAIKRIGGLARKKFIAATPGLQKLLERLEEHAARHKWLPGLDGRRVPVRAIYTALNFIVTSSEAIICKRWLVRAYDELCARFRYGWDGDVVIVLWIHDELVCCCRPEIADQVGEILVRHAKEPGEFYKFKTPLDADYKIGRSWAGEAIEPRQDSITVNASMVRDAVIKIPIVETVDEDDVPQPVTPADIAAVNAALIREGIAPLNLSAAAPESSPPLPDDHTTPDDERQDNETASAPTRAGNGPNYFKRKEPAGRTTVRYTYIDEQGNLHARKNRTSTKNFWQQRWQDGHWITGQPGIKYLYGICELLAAPPQHPVWITEGEKDRNKLTDDLKLLAVTNPGGSGKWHSDFTAEQIERWFKGRRKVYALEDNDAPGRKHVEIIGRALHHLVGEIRIVSFRELPEGGDVTDWLESGHTKAELLARAAASPLYRPPALQSIGAADVTMTAVDWLWPNRFAIGKLGIIAGLPDEGKGLLISYIAAQVTNGGAWPCKEGAARRGNVILFSAEDDPSDTVVPRLAAAGADLKCIEIVKMVREAGNDRMFSLQSDLVMLRRKIGEVGDVVLVLIDPISAYLGVGKMDSYRTTDVRAVLGPLVDLAAELKISIVAIMHFNKKVDITNALLRISDSLAFSAAARHVYGVINDTDNKRKLMVRAKNNLAANTAEQTTLAFTFAAREVGDDPNACKTIVAPYIVWEPDYVDVTAAEAMQAAGENKSPGARDEAKKFLLAILANGPVAKTEIEEAAKAEGISGRTLYRAKRELKNIVAKKDAGDGGWTWRLVNCG